jgi:hypothetical protein
MQATGASREVVSAYRAQLVREAEERAIYIFPENWHAWKVFRGMGTQWRVTGGFGSRLYEGLDYSALPVVLAEHRQVQPRQPLHVLMPQLRTLEAAARDILNQD